jgi:hypothetical protein
MLRILLSIFVVFKGVLAVAVMFGSLMTMFFKGVGVLIILAINKYQEHKEQKEKEKETVLDISDKQSKEV